MYFAKVLKKQPKFSPKFIKETDNKLLEILRHRKDGSKSCSTCPTRNNEGYSILDYHNFMGNKDPYMSTELIKE